MTFINLNGQICQEADAQDVCFYCQKPFQHYTKTRKIKGQDGLKELELITSHPICKRTNKKMESIKNKIVKAKQTLHNLRAAQLNLEFEAFLAGQKLEDENTDEIFTILTMKNKEAQNIN